MNSSRTLTSLRFLLQSRQSRFDIIAVSRVGAVQGGLNLLEGDRRHKALGLPGLADFGVELVNLFEREALGLVDAQVYKRHAHAAEAAPDEEDLGSEVAGENSVSTVLPKISLEVSGFPGKTNSIRGNKEMYTYASPGPLLTM